MTYKVIRREPMPRDRRDYFVAETDVWQLAKHIAAVRKAREINPALDTLNSCLTAAAEDDRVTDEQVRRPREMQEFTAAMSRWHDKMSSLPSTTLSRLVAMGDTGVKVLNLGRKS